MDGETPTLADSHTDRSVVGSSCTGLTCSHQPDTAHTRPHHSTRHLRRTYCDPGVVIYDVKPVDFLDFHDQVPRIVESLDIKYMPIEAYDLLGSTDQILSGCIICPLYPSQSSPTEIQCQLRMLESPLPVIFYSARASTATIVKTMKNGASGFFTLPADPTELSKLVQEAFEENKRRLKERQQTQHLRTRFSDISAEEEQVLKMILQGLPNKQIASQLQVHIRTIESRKHRLMGKTSSKSVADLIVSFCEFRELQEPFADSSLLFAQEC